MTSNKQVSDGEHGIVELRLTKTRKEMNTYDVFLYYFLKSSSFMLLT